MGMSFTTLSLYGAERSALEAALAPGDLLRDRNLPWLTLVPAQEEEGDFPLRLEKAARRLTKGSDAVALLFFITTMTLLSADCIETVGGPPPVTATNPGQSWENSSTSCSATHPPPKRSAMLRAATLWKRSSRCWRRPSARHCTMCRKRTRRASFRAAMPRCAR